MHLPPPPLDYWYTSSFWQVQVPYTKSQLQRFRVVHWAVQIRFRSYLFSSHPRLSLKCPSSFALFLSARLISIILRSIFYFCLVPPKLLCAHDLFLVSYYALPYFLDYAIPPYSSSPFCYFFLYSPISYGWQPLFLACSLLYIANSTFSRLYLFEVGTFPVLLLILCITRRN